MGNANTVAIKFIIRRKERLSFPVLSSLLLFLRDKGNKRRPLKSFLNSKPRQRFKARKRSEQTWKSSSTHCWYGPRKRSFSVDIFCAEEWDRVAYKGPVSGKRSRSKEGIRTQSQRTNSFRLLDETNCNQEIMEKMAYPIAVLLFMATISGCAGIFCEEIPYRRRFLKGDDPKLLLSGEKMLCDDDYYPPPTTPPPTTTTQTTCPCACTSVYTATQQCAGSSHCWVQTKYCTNGQKMCCC